MFRKAFPHYLFLAAFLVLSGCTGSTSFTPANSGSTGTGSALVSWTAPMTRQDGSAISIGEIGGYYVYYGTSISSMTHSVTVAGGSSSQYQVTGLTPATYYFRVSAYDLQGIEGAPSAVGSKTIN